MATEIASHYSIEKQTLSLNGKIPLCCWHPITTSYVLSSPMQTMLYYHIGTQWLINNVTCHFSPSVMCPPPRMQTLLLYKEVITRVTVTIAMLAVIRCGLFISLPGIDFGRMPAAEVASHGGFRGLSFKFCVQVASSGDHFYGSSRSELLVWPGKGFGAIEIS